MILHTFLKSLGDTASAVADTLKSKGIRGRRGSRCHCPIAIAIYENCSLRVRISSHAVNSDDSDGLRLACLLDYPAVHDFICRFDNGYYPGLEW